MAGALTDCSKLVGWPTAAALFVAVLVMVGLPVSLLGAPKWRAQGKHVLITGGSQGLGLALAELLASDGADVTICARSKDKLEKAVDQIKVRISWQRRRGDDADVTCPPVRPQI